MVEYFWGMNLDCLHYFVFCRKNGYRTISVKKLFSEIGRYWVQMFVCG